MKTLLLSLCSLSLIACSSGPVVTQTASGPKIWMGGNFATDTGMQQAKITAGGVTIETLTLDQKQIDAMKAYLSLLGTKALVEKAPSILNATGDTVNKIVK